MRVARPLTVFLLVLALAALGAACSGDDGSDSDDAAVTTMAGETTAESGSDDDAGSATDPDGNIDEADDVNGPARSEQIDELLAMHPIFATKRFMNFAARGKPGACSLLSAKGRRAIEKAQGRSCEDTIRAAASEHDEAGLVIGGEFVPAEDFADLDFRTTIYVFEREQGRVTIDGMRPPIRLSQYGRIWLIDAIPTFDEIATVN